MAIGKRVTVTTTATVIHTPDAHSNAELVLTNSGSVAIDLGDATVTAGGGFQLAAGASMVVQVAAPNALYGIAPSGSAVVQVLVPDGEGNQAPSLSGAGTVIVGSAASTAAETNVASSASSVTLLASNAARKGWSVFNDSTAVLYVKFGATASATSYTVQVAAGGYYESPQLVYTGRVDAIWAAANGNARVTELS